MIPTPENQSATRRWAGAALASPRYRRGLLLYTLLLILPTALLGLLLWEQQRQDQRADRDLLPLRREDAAQALVSPLREDLGTWIEFVDELPYDAHLARRLVGSGSELRWESNTESGADLEAPAVARFSSRFFLIDRGDTVLLPDFLESRLTEQEEGLLAEEIAQFAGDWLSQEPVARIARFVRDGRLRFRRTELSTQELAALMAQTSPRPDLLSLADLEALGNDPGRAFLRRFDPSWAVLRETITPEGDRRRYLLVIKRAQIEFYVSPQQQTLRLALDPFVPFYLGEGALAQDFDLRAEFLYGLVLDAQWLLDEGLESAAVEALALPQVWRRPSSEPPAGNYVLQPVSLTTALDIETEPDIDLTDYDVQVGIDAGALTRRHQLQDLRFGLMALLLAASLATGLWFLLSAVRRDLEKAKAQQNFVAAVTHELRTPISTIALHAEMLKDGWASDPERQQEYYGRIATETGRLSSLVESVLTLSNLTRGRIQAPDMEPAPADLNNAVTAVIERLTSAGREDVQLELSEDLPEVPLTREATDTILTNLVTNARKYGQPELEPVLVRTRRHDRGVALEVLDRGPGVPAGERDRIFEAFYRIGNESTRSSKGTGLGLHLVALQARALGGRVSVEERSGGGSVFRVVLPAAR